jgi:hypothetical protein
MIQAEQEAGEHDNEYANELKHVPNHAADSDLQRTEILIGWQVETKLAECEHSGERQQALGQVHRIETEPVVAIDVQPVESTVDSCLRSHIVTVQIAQLVPEFRIIDAIELDPDDEHRVEFQSERCHVQREHAYVNDIVHRVQIERDAIEINLFDLI